jgi:hypothetical protein
MTRTEQLRFCRRCLKKDFNPKKGIVCSLTDDIADFEGDCEYFALDSSVNIQENVKISSKRKSRKKIKQKREPEIITGDDIALLLGVTLANTFMIRIFFYFSLDYNKLMPLLFSFIITLLSISVALLVRNKEISNYSFKGNIKFKILYTLFLTHFHTVYAGFLGLQHANLGYVVFATFSSVFILSMMSYVIVKPAHFMLARYLKLHEKFV